jgi:hypothetical protein
MRGEGAAIVEARPDPPVLELYKARVLAAAVLYKKNTALVLSAFPICLSRACLGKMMKFLVIKWHRKRGVF